MPKNQENRPRTRLHYHLTYHSLTLHVYSALNSTAMSKERRDLICIKLNTSSIACLNHAIISDKYSNYQNPTC